MDELKTYGVSDVASTLKTTRQKVNELRLSGCLKFLKVGKRYLCTSQELQRFLKDYEGYNLANYESMVEARKEVEKC